MFSFAKNQFLRNSTIDYYWQLILTLKHQNLHEYFKGSFQNEENITEPISWNSNLRITLKESAPPIYTFE